MSLRELPFDDLFAGWEEATIDTIRKRAKILGATHVVIFENHMFDSSQFGQRTALLVGPTCTYHDPSDCEGHWLKDLPSQRQYPVAYAPIPKHEKEAEDGCVRS